MSHILVSWKEGEVVERQVVPACWIISDDVYWPTRETRAVSYQRECIPPKLNGKWDVFPVEEIIMKGTYKELDKILKEMSEAEFSDPDFERRLTLTGSSKNTKEKSVMPKAPPPPKNVMDGITLNAGKTSDTSEEIFNSTITKAAIHQDEDQESVINVGKKRSITSTTSARKNLMDLVTKKAKSQYQASASSTPTLSPSIVNSSSGRTPPKNSTPNKNRHRGKTPKSPANNWEDDSANSSYNFRDLPNSPYRNQRNDRNDNSDNGLINRDRQPEVNSIDQAMRLLSNQTALPTWLFQKMVLKLLTDIRDLNRRRVFHDESEEFELIDSRERYDDIEKKLIEKNDESNLKSHLKDIGGTDAGDCTRNMLIRTFTLEMLAEMNMKGRGGGKIAFGSSMIYKKILSLVKKKYKVDESVVKKAVEQKLRNAPKQLRQQQGNA